MARKFIPDFANVLNRYVGTGGCRVFSFAGRVRHYVGDNACDVDYPPLDHDNVSTCGSTGVGTVLEGRVGCRNDRVLADVVEVEGSEVLVKGRSFGLCIEFDATGVRKRGEMHK